MPDYWPFSILRHSALRERVIVELDHGSPGEALRMVERLVSQVGMFKVGKHLFLQAGPELLRGIRRRGGEIFLDLKFQDSPRMLSRAAAQATRLGVKMFDLHPSYSLEGMERTRAEISRLCQLEGLRRPYLLAVAMYLSLVRPAEASLGEDQQLARLARLAAQAVVDGVLTDPEHASRVRAVCGRRFLIVTSGRGQIGDDGLAGGEPANHTLRAGADYLVLGRALWEAADPQQRVNQILTELERGLRSGPRIPASLLAERPPPP